MALLIVYSLLVVLASLLGGWLPSLVELTHRRMQLLLSAVAGVMLGVALLHLLPHAAMELNSLDRACGWATAGLLAMFFLMRGFHAHSHAIDCPGETAQADPTQACATPHAHEHAPAVPAERAAGVKRRGISWTGAAFGLTVHTMIDGAAVAAAIAADNAAAAGGEAGHVHALAGLGTFAAVALHKPLDSLSIATIMASQGWPPALRRWVNLGYALACPAGALLFWCGVGTLGASNALVGGALAFAAGVFLCVALADLLPEVEYHAHDRLSLSAALVLGVLAAYGIGFLEPGHVHALRRDATEQGHAPHDHSAHESHGHRHPH